MNEPTNALTTKSESSLVEYIPFGAAESIKLSISIVQNIIAVPTRSGKLPTQQDCMKFMMLCRGKHLDPFTGDCFMLGYDTQSGPQFSLITAHQVFLKRAEAAEDFEGMESGVIFEKDDAITEREGDFLTKGETLLGGWARVFRKGKKPFYRRLNLEIFSTGRSRWEKDPAGMIVKCAEADALRSAFPTHLGGLYMEDRQTINVQATERPSLPKIESASIVDTASVAPAQPAETQEAKEKRHRRTKAEMEAARAAEATQSPEQTPAPDSDPIPVDGPSDRDKLKMLVEESGYTEAQAMHTLRKMRFATPAAAVYDDLKESIVSDILADPKTLIDGIAATFA